MLYSYDDEKAQDLPTSDAKEDLLRQFSRRTVYSGSYWAHLLNTMFGCPCCPKSCQERRRSLQHYQKSVSRLDAELDILAFVRNRRISDFVNRIVLKQHQRYFINKFALYHLFTKDEEDAANQKVSAAHAR